MGQKLVLNIKGKVGFFEQKNRILKKFTLVLLTFLNISLSAQTTEEVDYSTPKSYEIGGIIVNGADNLNNSTLITSKLYSYRRRYFT